MNFDWSELAFGTKRPIDELEALFIAAPRELSAARFKQIVKKYLPQGNIVLGLAKESYVLGLEGQPQFHMLQDRIVQNIIDKVSASPSPYKIYTLSYFQREANYLLEKLDFHKALFVNGSWRYSFHMQPVYYTLASRRIDYELISPFADEQEAMDYEKNVTKEIKIQLKTGTYTESEMLQATKDVARLSFDHTSQTGVALGKKTSKGFQLLTTSFNKVVPYQTYAMHFGSLREQHFSPANDLNYYDAVHAEVMLLLAAQKANISLKHATLFINVLPCPTCGRMLAETDIAEVVYSLDHSDGYTLRALERAGKKVRRVL